MAAIPDMTFTPSEAGIPSDWAGAAALEAEILAERAAAAVPQATAAITSALPVREGTRGALYTAGSWLNPPDRPIYLRPWFLGTVAVALGLGIYHFTRKG